MIKTAVMKLLTVKAAAVIALTAAGGVAVAATTGTMPTMLTGSEHNGSGLSAADGHGKPSTQPSADAKGNGHDQDGKDSDGAKGSPSPSLVGLCHAIEAGNKDEHGKALESPAFTALITTAGGKDKVDAFCTALLASASAAPKEHPSRPADAGSPSEASDHRTGPPADHRTGKPSTPAHP